MSKEKLYFKNEKSETCYELSDHIFEAKCDKLTEIELIEAIPDNSISDTYWCGNYSNQVDRCECKKSECDSYTPINGKNGICFFRGKLYTKGKKVSVNVETGSFL